MKNGHNFSEGPYTGSDQERLILLLRYIEKEANTSEIKQVEQWLSEDPDFYQIFKMTMQQIDDPPTLAEQQAAAASIGLDQKTIHSKIMAQIGGSSQSNFERISTNIRHYAYQIAATAAIFLGIFGARPMYIMVMIERPISGVKESLLASHRIHIDDPRLAGGYLDTGVGQTMSPKTLYAEEENILKGVLSRDPENELALRKLALIYLARSQESQKDSVVNILQSAENPSAELLNDLGVFAYQDNNWESAIQFFEQSLDAKAPPPEAIYNLALALEKANRLPEAAEQLQIYLDQESREGWRRAAQRILNRIQANIGQ